MTRNTLPRISLKDSEDGIKLNSSSSASGSPRIN